MKIKISQNNLNKGLSLAGRFVANRPQLPILANFLFQTADGRLKISATNLDLGINLYLGAVVEEEGRLAVSAREVAEFVSYLPAGEIVLESEKTGLRIISSQSEAVFSGTEAKDFPEIPRAGKTGLLFDPAEFSRAVSQVSFAAAADETRPVLAGVFFQFDKNGYQLVATDGYRLSLKKIASSAGAQTKGSFLIPARSLQEAVKLAKKEKIKVSLDKKQSQVVFTVPDYLEAGLSSRLLEGEFPDYQKIIPRENSIRVSVDREDLLAAVKIASVFARQAGNVIIFDFKNDRLEIKADSPQVGKNNTFVSIKLEGKEIKAAFNYRFLLDYLGSLDSEDKEIEIKMNGPLSPVVFEVKGDDSFLHLIMPINLEEK